MAAPAFRAVPVRVRTPATSANLGPGFDAFGMALSLYDDVVVRVADGGLRVDIAGEGAESLSRGEEHLVVRSLRAAFDALGGQPPGLEVVCANRVPHGRGLGSSASAICAGLVAAQALALGGAERLDADRLLALATELEGHPDNVAACLRGGFTLAWTETVPEPPAAPPVEPVGPSVPPMPEEPAPPGPRVRPRVLRLDVDPRIVPLVFIPAEALATSAARGLLPPTVPHADAALNAGRAGLLVAAVTGHPELLLPATEERLHQGYRASAMPDSAALVEALRAEGFAAVVSGAGPTVLALVTEAEVAAAYKAAREVVPLPPGPPAASASAGEDGGVTAADGGVGGGWTWTARRLDVAGTGATQLPLL